MAELPRSQARYRNNGTTNKPKPSATTTPGWNANTMSTHATSASHEYREEKIETTAEEYRRVNPTPPVQSGGKAERSGAPGQPIKEVADARASSRRSGASNGFGVLDALRVLAGMLVVSAGLSYLSTSGESMTWGYNPWWTRAREWRALMHPEVRLTDTELLAYDGTDPTKPIYIALNGTIYDVSAAPKTYGPGGSYHFFAGRDAARAFLTGCFADDLTADLRGVEEMFMPVDASEAAEADAHGDPAANQHRDTVVEERANREKKRRALSRAELKNRHAQELRLARKSMREGLEHWHSLFRGDKGKPYFRVGEVVREEGWLEKLPRRELCEAARKSRPVRKEV